MAEIIETWNTALDNRVLPICSNDDLRLTFDLFTHRSDLVPSAFMLENA